jgi:hypothetical protein
MRSTALTLLTLGAGLALGTSTAGAAPPTADDVLVQLHRAHVCTDAARLAAAGGRPAVPSLHVWRLPPSARGLAESLLASGVATVAQPNHTHVTPRAASVSRTDPLSADEWWRGEIGLTGLTPPGPGVPVTVVDSGLDFSHPEFAGRPDTVALNPQEPAPLGGEHGTAVASLIGAPLNGQGIVGIYPEARLRSWDAARGDGTRLDTVEIVNGILAASQPGRGVINLSLGGTERDPLIEQAVAQALTRGALVVAASGNDGEAGSPLGYPAVLPHVITVAATTRSGTAAPFSSRSPYVDLAAPGADITVATALGNGWHSSSGTSFSTPLVAGAAAWIWTSRPELDWTQVAELLRRGARDLGPPGRDAETGHGMLDVRAALIGPAPARDPLEPNDDVDLVDPEATDFVGIRPLTTRGRRTASIAARLAALEDPRDVYRLWVPAKRTLVVRSVAASSDVDLSLWRQGTLTAVTRLPGADRIAHSAHAGPADQLRWRNTGAGRTVYVSVTPHRGVAHAEYRLSVTAR